MIDLRHGKKLAGLVVHHDGRQLRIAAEQAALRVAQRIFDGVGRRQRGLATGMDIDRYLTVLDQHMRHQGIGSLFQPPVAADDSGRHAVEVMHQRAAERQQHERHRQPKYQLTADGRGHADLASSRR